MAESCTVMLLGNPQEHMTYCRPTDRSDVAKSVTLLRFFPGAAHGT